MAFLAMSLDALEVDGYMPHGVHGAGGSLAGFQGSQDACNSSSLGLPGREREAKQAEGRCTVFVGRTC